MWKFKPPHAKNKGFSLVEIIVVMAIVTLLVAIAVPAALQQRNKSNDALMKADLLKVSTAMKFTLSNTWSDVPPADVALTFVSPSWSIQYASVTLASGKAATGNTLSGTIWQDGSYCAQVDNPSGSNPWRFRSDTEQITAGSCPTTALGVGGTLPTSTVVTLPAAPTNLTAVNTSNIDNSVDVSWTSVAGATSYTVSVTGVLPITVAAPGVSTTVANIAGGVTTISVRAVNTSGSGLASNTSLTVNGGTLFPTGVTTPLTTAAGSSTLNRVQIGTVGLGLGGTSLTSDASTIKFGTNAASATAAWIAGRADGGLNFYTQTNGGSIINNLSLTTAANTFNTDVKILSPTAATNTTTGALNVTGGVGVQGAMYVGGNLVISGTCTGCSTGISIVDDTSTNAIYYPVFTTATIGNLNTAGVKTSSTKLTFNPSTGVLSANLTGSTNLPISTGVSGLGTGVATFLATPSSSNLATAVTGATGTGALVFGTSPTLVTPNLGIPSALTLTNATGLPISTGVSGLGTGVATFLATPSSTNLATALTDKTGSGSVVFSTSPTLVTPNLGTPSALTLTNATGLPISTGVSGLGTGVATFLATASSTNLASALIDKTGTGSLVFGTSPSLTDPKIYLALNAQVGITYTLVLADSSKLITATNSSSQTYSIPTNAFVAFPIGTQINILGLGAGTVTINAVTPATTIILSSGQISNSPVLRAQYSSVTLIKTATDTWYVIGDMVKTSTPKIPDAPTIGTAAQPGPTTATIAFTAPILNGGAPIIDYTATSSPGGITGVLTHDGSGTITVTGLMPTTTYTFTVRARNSIGYSVPSAPSNSITTATIPGAPTIGTATATGAITLAATATVAFTAPASNGADTIIDYTATSSPGGITAVLTQVGSGTITVTGLTAGTTYTFTVRARNSIGYSVASAPSNSILVTSVPGAPTIGTANDLNASVSVNFTAPVNNGGSPITGYTVTTSPGGATGTGSASPIVVSGLTNGTSYTFTVRATNSIGTSLPSGSSNAAVPAKATGGSVTYSGGYAYHVFTGGDTFTPRVSLSAEWIVIGGGGGSGGVNGIHGTAGAGAGRATTGTGTISTAQIVTIGAGGAGGLGGASASNGTSGGASSFNGTSSSGGFGGTSQVSGTGAASGDSLYAGGIGAAGNGGGGGGSAGVGGNATGDSSGTNPGGPGGGGAATSWNGYSYASGGSGGLSNGRGGQGAAGSGGSGGGGASNNSAGANGGSGIVIVRYIP